jgi:hypothetical protein
MIRFQRLVLEVGQGAIDSETMREAAALALLLDAQLHALFVEDETLLHASALPFAREISPLSYRWRPLEPDRLEAELKAAADQARRRFLDVASATGVRQSFEVRRGDLAMHISAICAASDIVVVAAPRRMGTGTTHGFRLLRETARRSTSSVLHLPPSVARRRGPVVSVLTGADDPSLPVARQIAAAAKEQLVVLAEQAVGDMPAQIIPGMTSPEIGAALGNVRERLIVIAHDRSPDGVGVELAMERGVPVLVVEPVPPGSDPA